MSTSPTDLAASNRFAPVQSFMREQRMDGWMLYDFRGSNPVFAQLLPGKRWTTRRAMLWIPATGEPRLAAHAIDGSQFTGLTVAKDVYLSWQELHGWVKAQTGGAKRIAMEYSPMCELPAVSIADAGTIELVKSNGAEIVSSADAIQICVATWDDAAQRNHARASADVARVKDSAFDLIRTSLSAGKSINEYEVQQHILRGFAAAGLETTEPPIVAANAHGGDPHFEVSSTSPAMIRKGDWVLIDLWARVPGDENIFSDITWVGCCGEPSAKHLDVFNVVKRARDACVERAKRAWMANEPVEGWQLDDAAREQIISAGYEHFIKHRTGHSLSPGPKVHGMGVNIDNLETHDTRRLLPGVGYTVEPGVYLPGFGVRLEINVFVDPKIGPRITSCVQDEIVIC